MNNNTEIKTEEFSLITIFKLISLNLKFYIYFVVILCVLVGIYSLIMPNTYTASASILPPKKDGGGGLSSYIQSMAGDLGLGTMGQNDQPKIFTLVLKSRTVADFIIDSLKLKSNPRFQGMSNDKLAKSVLGLIDIEADKSGTIFINASTQTGYLSTEAEQRETAKFAANIAKYAIMGLDNVMRDRSMSSAKQSKEYIDSQLKKYRVRLDSITKQLENFQIKNKVISIDEQSKAIVSQAIEIGSQLSKSEIEYSLAQMEFSDNSPRLKFYKEQVDLLTEQYNKIQSGGITGNDAFAIPLDSIPSLMKEYADLFRQRKIYEQVMMYLETQYHQEAIQEKKDIPFVEVLDPAKVPDERSAPIRITMLILTFFLANILAIIIIVIKAFLKGRTYILEKGK
ncbi:MAG TPA: Wzz/FepE/Etk N-terminal domain-containing protein [Candidatus Kapabacteria bacterium]|nr:Wzz/FepE/Etk N-terminal domain-containing protein [Candidatus Kapabacteria bacterium]